MSTPTDRKVETTAPQPVPASVYRPHPYHPDPDYASYDGLSDHLVPCTCGSAEGAFVHSEEAYTTPHTVMAISAGDGGAQGEAQALGGNGKALVLPGRDTREGTPLETQEPGTTRSGAVDEEIATAAGPSGEIVGGDSQTLTVDSVGSIEDVTPK